MGSRGFPREMGGSLLQTTKGRWTLSWAGGRAPGSYSFAGPEGKFIAPKPIPPRGQREPAGPSLLPPKGVHTVGRGEGLRRLGPLHLQLMYSQCAEQARVTAPSTQTPQVRQSWAGCDTEYPSSPGGRWDKRHLPRHLGSLNTVFLACAHGSLSN